MAHRTARDGYRGLVERLNRFPQGAPPSERLFQILRLLFSEREAGLVAALPIKPFTAARAARIWKMKEGDARGVLDALAGRGLLVDSARNGRSLYSLPPPMAGFFEFSLMRVRTDVDQKVLSELFYQYLNEEEEFIKALFVGGPTQLGRVFVSEPALPADGSLQVLDYERASEVARTARHRAVGLCYCRHKMTHLGRACDAPLDICLTFNTVAGSLSRHGIAREIDAVESLDLLQRARDLEPRPVRRERPAEGQLHLQLLRLLLRSPARHQTVRIGLPDPHELSAGARSSGLHGLRQVRRRLPGRGDVPRLRGRPAAAEKAPGAAGRDALPRLRRLREGLCSSGCLSLVARPDRVITPLDSTRRAVAMAVERGTLQHLIFDNRAHWNHRVMAAILGGVLRLPPVKRALAGKQMQSRYLEFLMSRAPRA